MSAAHASPGAFVYARALMEVVEADGGETALREVGDRLAALGKAWSSDSTLRAYFLSANVGDEEKAATLGRWADDQGSKTLGNFLRMLHAKERLGLLDELADAFTSLLDERLGRVPVTITTAVPVSEADFRTWTDQIRAVVGGEPVIEHVVDPAIVAGALIRVGDQVLDGSVRRRLNELRQSIIERGKQTHALQS